MTRYQQLRQRRERIIELNHKHDYVTMVLTKDGLKPNPKNEQYINCLLQINRECVALQREHDKKFDKSNYKFNAKINYNEQF